MGQKKKWYIEGGPERDQASDHFRQASVMAELIYGDTLPIVANVYKEFADHLMSRHQEKGRPEYVLWNKCANIPDDQFSSDARLYFEKAISVYQYTVLNIVSN